MSKEDSRKFLTLGVFSVFLISFWTVILGYSIHAALPINAIELPFGESVYARLWLPQGWKFFTRDPREDDIKAFIRKREGEWTNAMNGPNGSPSNFFGVSRVSRAQGIELGLLTTAVRKSAWQPCKEEPESCLEAASPLASMKNITPKPTLCGEVGLVLQPPVPWAWSKSADEITMPSKVIRIVVQC